MAHYNRIIVKIGSNVLTRHDGTLDVTRMSALVDQVADLHKQGIEVVMVSSGCGTAFVGSENTTLWVDNIMLEY